MADGNKLGAVGDRTTSASSSHEVTYLLRAWGSGDEDALQRLIPVVYPELRRIARRYMSRERSSNTLQTTALVHEAYLRLVDLQGVNWQDRSHFFAICARLMRRILIDLARSKLYQKKGEGKACVCLDEGRVMGPQPPADIVALDEALKALAALDPRKEQVVELRFFGGLSVEETAHVLRVSNETVMRDWRLAKTWLWRELSQENSHGD
jgi:RNA polymerase sigma factor (TIGR02999 family)